MVGSGQVAFLYFVALIISGNFIILNLFIGALSEGMAEEEEDDPDPLVIAVDSPCISMCQCCDVSGLAAVAAAVMVVAAAVAAVFR